MVLAVIVALSIALGPLAQGVASSPPAPAGAALDADLATASVGPDGLAASSPLLPDAQVTLAPFGPAAGGDDPASEPVAPQASSASAQLDATPAPPGVEAAAGVSVLALLAAAAWAVARALGIAPLLPFFSRIEDGDLARHPARRAALDHIAANPGASVQELKEALGLAWGTTVHHLRRLERAGLVAVRKEGGRRGHWPLGCAPPRDGIRGPDRALAALVASSPGLAQKELARITGMGAPTACKRLARLEAAGFVAQVRDGRARLYVPTAKLLAAGLVVPAVARPVPDAALVPAVPVMAG